MLERFGCEPGQRMDGRDERHVAVFDGRGLVKRDIEMRLRTVEPAAERGQRPVRWLPGTEFMGKGGTGLFVQAEAKKSRFLAI